MHKPQTIIQPVSRLSVNLQELWRYRELFYFFTWRDIKVKYKQTLLGVLWVVIQPLALMMLFTLVFAKNFSSAASAIDYKVFVLSGLILWNLFYSATSHASESIVLHANIIKKIYFPRLIIIGSAILTALFDFIIAFILFLLLCLLWQQPIHWSAVLFFPAGVLLVLISAFGIGTLLASLNIKYRDFRYALPLLLQFLFFASQVVYSLTEIKQQWAKQLLALNPVNAAIELFRMALGNEGDTPTILTGTATAIILSIIGIVHFRKTEAYFADLA
jgi:lipopolysaccharide transport system permease protein